MSTRSTRPFAPRRGLRIDRGRTRLHHISIEELFGGEMRIVTEPRYTVIYDGDCRVCQRSVDLLRRWDTRAELEIIPSRATEVSERFFWIPEEDFEASMQVVDARSGARRRWQGAAGFERILEVLPRGRVFSLLFRIPLVRPIAEWVYRRFARNRKRFGCGDHCAIPGR